MDGISCIRPLAPARLSASGRKRLSWRITANSSARSTWKPPLGAQAGGGENYQASRPEVKRPGPSALEQTFPGRFGHMFACPKPIIAAINGPCAGIGLILTLFADLRYAAADAKFTTAFAQRGLIAEHGIAWQLPRLVGEANALDLLFTARKFDGVERDIVVLESSVNTLKGRMSHPELTATWEIDPDLASRVNIIN